jgi:pyrimidine-specific ribonucleoside hydrolase
MKTASIMGVASALALASCGSDALHGEPPPSRLPIVVDTDAGLDDAIALLYLATSPEVDLRAVTVSGTGLAHCFPGARNVVGLLELAGRGDVPVSCGPEAPLDAAAILRPFPDDWRRVADGRYGDAWRIGAGSLDDRPAPELLVEAVKGSESPVTLITLGPLTNVAAALQLDDVLAVNIERVVLMGGAFDVAGNTAGAQPSPVRNVAEWNIYADPAAARDVVQAELPLTFVPLDATNRVPLDLYVLRAVTALATATDPIGVVNTLLGGLRGMIGTGDYYLWDPLAAVLALRPELGSIEPRQVEVVTRGPEAGRTVDTESAGGARVNVYVGADGRAAEVTLLEGLAGEPVTRIEDRPDLVIEPDACTATPGELIAGPRVLQIESGDAASGSTSGVAIGTLAPGRGPADIEAFLAAPAAQPPDWFTITAALGAGIDAPTADLVRLVPGSYTVVCLRGAPSSLELLGTTTFTVRD